MEIKKYMAAIEAILFASGEPVEASRIAEVLEIDEETAIRFADDLMSDYNTRGGGITMVRLDKSYQLCSSRDYADYVRHAMDIRRNTPLSQAAMEVLSIVAYNQPVTRSYIEQVRGVDCSAVVQGLLAKDLIEEKGRLELPGRPLIYGTTLNFLRCFGISKLEELPELPQEENQDEPNASTETTLDELIQLAEHAKNIAESEE